MLLHGFLDTWRSWELVLPALERTRDVFAPTLPGHAGGPSLGSGVTTDGLLDALEQILDDAGIGVAQIAGNSLGGYLALRLAQRGRASSVVALAPAGGWAAAGGGTVLAQQLALHERLKGVGPQAAALVDRPNGKRAATAFITTQFEHIPSALLAHQILGVAGADGAPALINLAGREGWRIDAEAITCPLRLVWGTADKLLPWPEAADGYRASLPLADWVLLDDVGHCPQLDVPLETAQLILGFSGER